MQEVYDRTRPGQDCAINDQQVKCILLLTNNEYLLDGGGWGVGGGGSCECGGTVDRALPLLLSVLSFLGMLRSSKPGAGLAGFPVDPSRLIQFPMMVHLDKLNI